MRLASPLLCLMAATACAGGGPPDPVRPRADGGPGAADAATDAGPGDAGDDPRCPPCAAGRRCDAASGACVDVDRCDGVECPPDHECVAGACVSPDADGDGHTVAGGDCDDARDDVHPGRDERCNGRDDDCDDEVDEGACRVVVTASGRGSEPLGTSPEVRVVEGDGSRVGTQPYRDNGGGSFSWGVFCREGDHDGCDLDCSGAGFSTHGSRRECFADDEEWRARCTVTIVCP